jgi:restriction system protein
MENTDKLSSGRQVWIVRAGQQAEIVADFLRKSVVAVGWYELADFPVRDNWDAFRAEVRKRVPETESEQKVGAAAGQLWAFIHEIKKSDYVVTPDRRARQVHVGVVEGDYKYDPTFDPHYSRTRSVRWLAALDWDSLPALQRNTLAGLRTVYQPGCDFSTVVRAAENPQDKVPPVQTTPLESAEGVPAENLAERAEEAIRTKLRELHFDDFQRLVGAVFKAAGFRVLFDSAGKGKDAGIDLILSKDRLGAGEKIIVQVKQREARVEQKELQQLVGTLKANEHGLMVSTGGITSDANRYWREHRDRLLVPMGATEFIALLGDSYEHLDSEFKAMLPLRKTYVPVTPEE